MSRLVKGIVLAGVFAEMVACSGSDSNSGAGGSTIVAGSGNGGSTGSGGTVTNNGGSKSAVGGASNAVGGGTTLGTGGMANVTGGAAATGGVAATGGAAATGGSANAGNPGTGGANPTGGNPSTATTGGAKATGGATNAAGATSTGGTKAAGGASNTGGSKSAGGTTTAGGAKATGGTMSTGGTGMGGSTTTTHVSVLQHHNHASRDGIYVDAPASKGAATMHIDTTFAGATLTGPTYAQPLYLAGTGGGPDLVIAATEQNHVYAFNAATGALVYNMALASPITSSALPCGNISPQLGITGTPIIDSATRTLYVDAMTGMGATASSARHMVYALNADTGATLTGWPVDLNATVASGGTTFNSLVQNQRGALALLGGKVFVPFGGHLGDCGSYHGWIVGISTTDPTQVSAWRTRAIAGGIWAPGGIASDGTSLFFATGNTEGNAGSFAPPGSYQDGESIFRLSPSLAAVSANVDFFAPTNWSAMDQADADLGGTGPVVFDVAGATPTGLVIALGKDGNGYVLNRANLGGVAAPLSQGTLGGTLITAAAAYPTSSGTFVVFKQSTTTNCPAGQKNAGLMAIKIGATSPPTVTVAWCAGPATNSSPAVSMSNAQGQDAVVWSVGTDNKLHGVDGITGVSVYGGGAATDTMSAFQKFNTPIVANGRIFVATNSQVYAFTP